MTIGGRIKQARKASIFSLRKLMYEIGIIADDDVLTSDQLPDIEKVRPMLFGSFGSMSYYGIGENLGKTFSIGKELKSRK